LEDRVSSDIPKLALNTGYPFEEDALVSSLFLLEIRIQLFYLRFTWELSFC